MHIKLIIFDWDGTLMDSETKIVTCLRIGVEHAGLPAKTDEQLRHIIGLGLNEVAVRLFPDASQAQLQAFASGYRQAFLDQDVPTPLFDGVNTLLTTLKKHYQLAVATGKSRVGLERMLDVTNLANTFDVTRCADETRSKPDPLMLHEILDHQQVHAHEAVMVGDTTYDMEMAQKIDMPCLAVTHGAHDRHHLKPLNPTAILDHVTHVLPWLQQVENSVQ